MKEESEDDEMDVDEVGEAHNSVHQATADEIDEDVKMPDRKVPRIKIKLTAPAVIESALDQGDELDDSPMTCDEKLRLGDMIHRLPVSILDKISKIR